MPLCQRIIYSGRVQGVGFRLTAERLARGCAVAGFVKNLPNGTVELVVEGTAEEVDRYCTLLGTQMASYIAHADVASREPQGLTGFAIRY